MQNLKLIEEGARHRWIDDGGKPRSVTVLDLEFGDMSAEGTRRVTGTRPNRQHRCNGDGTVNVGRWDRMHKDWVFTELQTRRVA